MKRFVLAMMLTVPLALAGCGGAPSIEGVWKPNDGSGLKTIRADGTCTGMYYSQGKPLDIGGTATCQLGEKSSGGTYTLIVQQPPNSTSYTVSFDGQDAMSFDVGGRQLVLERQ